jgi:hypothetical protein
MSTRPPNIGGELELLDRLQRINQVDGGIRASTPVSSRPMLWTCPRCRCGIDVEDGSPFTLTGSRVDALRAVNGRVELEGLNDLSLPPLSVLGAIGVPPILLALDLDQMRTFRQRSAATEWRQLPPSMQPVPVEVRQWFTKLVGTSAVSLLNQRLLQTRDGSPQYSWSR